MSQSMLNQGLFEDQELPTQMGFFSFPPNYLSIPPFGCHQYSLKTLTSSLAADAPTSLTETLFSSATDPKQKDDITSHLGGPQLLSLQRSSANLWAWGEVNECMGNKRNGGDDHHHHLGISAMKMKKIKSRSRKVREPRFSFKTMSDVDVLDDGYKWRKYGQKVVKNTEHPRSYYRCTQDNCRVKKRVERLAEDPRMVITSYEGRHVHSPSHDEDDAQAPSQLTNFFW
uniref:Putative WRKY DNA-binding protein 13 n=1 Tax=Davidia involucrata TaxID=16924 RepID=A0A5B6YYP2_DAVIN